MKNLYLVSTLALLTLLLAPAPAVAAETGDLRFTINGEIEGLMPGDTLTLEKCDVLTWENQPVCDIIVEEAGRFSYAGSHPHTQYYGITYKPLSGKRLSLSKRDIPLLIKEGAIDISGTAEYIYFSKLKGGFYDDPYLQRYLQLDDSLGIERSKFYKLRDEAMLASDTTLGLEYQNKGNTFSSDCIEEFQRLEQLKEEFMRNSLSSELVALEILRTVSYSPLESTRDSYGKLTEDTKKSYYGKLLADRIETLERLAPGQPAPDFNLTTTEGTEVALDDYAGSHLLIYQFGLCPGSMYIDSHVKALYDKYKDRNFEILGITESFGTLESVRDLVPPNEEIFGINILDAIKSMLSHPWKDVQSSYGNNNRIVADYAFGGQPYFIFISPEGKLIARDFHDAFDKAKEVLGEQFPDTTE